MSEDPPNKSFKNSQTIKTILYPTGKREVLLRVINLADRFDGGNQKEIYFDVNAFARELYLEANSHNLTTSEQKIVKDLKLDIEEMNLAGSIGLQTLNISDKLTKWRTAPSQDPPGLIQKPKDLIHDVSLT